MAQTFQMKLANQLEISESSIDSALSKKKRVGDLSRKIYVLSERSKEESEDTISINLFHKQKSRISSGE